MRQMEKSKIPWPKWFPKELTKLWEKGDILGAEAWLSLRKCCAEATVALRGFRRSNMMLLDITRCLIEGKSIGFYVRAFDVFVTLYPDGSTAVRPMEWRGPALRPAPLVIDDVPEADGTDAPNRTNKKNWKHWTDRKSKKSHGSTRLKSGRGLNKISGGK